MAYKTPDQIATAAVAAGVAKSNLTPGRMLVGGFLGGAFIAFAGLVGIAGTSGLPTATWGTLVTLIFGLAFSLGLVLVIIAGSELLTGNMALLPMGMLAGRVRASRAVMSIALVLVGNFAGALFVAYVFAIKTGVIGTSHSDPASSGFLTFTRLSAIAKGKAVTETHLEVFLRAIACNWLVCLGVWMALAAEDIAGKILAIVFPITAFVAMGFDHVVANMFFLPAAIFAHVAGITWGNAFANLGLAFLGNFLGGGLFVGGIYWFLYLRGRPATTADGAVAGAGATARGASDGATSDRATSDRDGTDRDSHSGANAAGPR